MKAVRVCLLVGALTNGGLAYLMPKSQRELDMVYLLMGSWCCWTPSTLWSTTYHSSTRENGCRQRFAVPCFGSSPSGRCHSLVVLAVVHKSWPLYFISHMLVRPSPHLHYLPFEGGDRTPVFHLVGSLCVAAGFSRMPSLSQDDLA